MHRLLEIIGLCIALLACNASIPEVPVYAELDGQSIRTTVDSKIAKYYLEHYLIGDRIRPEFDSAIAAIQRMIEEKTLTREILKELTRTHSTDLAALVLWQHMLNDPANEYIQNLFAEEFSRLKTHKPTDAANLNPDENSYLMVFVPGWLYQTQPENGADFAEPRQVLSEAGMKTVLLEIEENGTVERNADIIVEQLYRLGNGEEKIIVVSASKAGPEVAIALSQLNQRESNHNVKAWVNIGGLLYGTTLADTALTWPTCWYVKLFIIKGESFEGIESLETGRSAERARQVSLPRDVTVVNYVGIPLSGQVSERARLGYSLLRPEGPNDGLTHILDEIPTGSVTIAELGMDHFFIDPDIHIKTVALAKSVIRLVEGDNSLQPNKPLQPTAQPLRGFASAELHR